MFHKFIRTVTFFSRIGYPIDPKKWNNEKCIRESEFRHFIPLYHSSIFLLSHFTPRRICIIVAPLPVLCNTLLHAPARMAKGPPKGAYLEELPWPSSQCLRMKTASKHNTLPRYSCSMPQLLLQWPPPPPPPSSSPTPTTTTTTTITVAAHHHHHMCHNTTHQESTHILTHLHTPIHTHTHTHTHTQLPAHPATFTETLHYTIRQTHIYDAVLWQYTSHRRHDNMINIDVSIK